MIQVRGNNDFHDGYIAGAIYSDDIPPPPWANPAWLEGWNMAKETSLEGRMVAIHEEQRRELGHFALCLTDPDDERHPQAAH